MYENSLRYAFRSDLNAVKKTKNNYDDDPCDFYIKLVKRKFSKTFSRISSNFKNPYITDTTNFIQTIEVFYIIADRIMHDVFCVLFFFLFIPFLRIIHLTKAETLWQQHEEHEETSSIVQIKFGEIILDGNKVEILIYNFTILIFLCSTHLFF